MALPSWLETFLPLDQLCFQRLSLRPGLLAGTLVVLRVCCIESPTDGGMMLFIWLLSRVVRPLCLGP